MGKVIFHIDVNSAYLSWSALRLLANGSDTDLRNIPAIIGGDMEKRHGVVLAKSIPAKKYGVENVKVGKVITLEIAGDKTNIQKEVESMCETLLANTVIENYAIKI